MIDGNATDAWVTGLGFTPTLNANQSWKVFEAIKTIASNVQASKRVSVVPTNDGQGFLILVHDLNNAPTPALIANKFAGFFGSLTPAQIEPLLDVHTFAGDTKRERIASARQYVENNPAFFDGAYVWRLDMHPPVPEFMEPEEPPEGWPISIPLEWVEIEEPE